MTATIPQPAAKRPPVVAMWICLVLAWIALVAPVPFTVVAGLPLTIIALVLAVMCLRRGRKLQGILGCIGSTVVSAIAYAIGLLLLTVIVGGELREDYLRRAAEAEAVVDAAVSPPVVAAATITADYAADHKAAEKKYDGVFDITGTVTGIGKDAAGFPTVSLAGATDAKVVCAFTRDRNTDLSGIGVGDELTVRGKVDWFLNVRLLASRIVE